MEELREIYEKYKIKDIEYKDIEVNKLSVLDQRQIHKLINTKGILIQTLSIIKHKNECLYIDEAIIQRNKISLRTTHSVFVRVKFDDVTFYDGSYKNCLFINCYFKNSVFNRNSFYNTSFINCFFDNVNIIDTEMKEVKFINSNPEDIMDDKNQSIIHSLQDIKVDHTPKEKLYAFLNCTGISDNQIKSEENNLAKLPSNGNGEEHMDKISEIAEKCKTGQVYENIPIDLENYLFSSCKFKNTIYSSKKIQAPTQLIDCKFDNVEFNSVDFSDVIFDDSIFTNCRFNNCRFVRCSFINTKIDSDSTVIASFYKCNLYKMMFECTRELSRFEETPFIESSSYSVSQLQNCTDIIKNLENVIQFINSNEFIESIDKPKPETTQEDVIEYFSKLNIVETMQLISFITNNCTAQASTQQEKYQKGSLKEI